MSKCRLHSRLLLLPVLLGCSAWASRPFSPLLTPVAACASRPELVGCSVLHACSAARLSTGLCSEFSLWGDICAVDAPHTAGCQGYHSACATAGTCNDRLAYLPTTGAVRDLVSSLCQDMPKMKACVHPPSGSVMDQYAAVCADMPGMRDCGSFVALCKRLDDVGWESALALHKAWHCPATSRDRSKMPQMLMFFHAGYVEYVLLESLVTSSGWEFALALGFAAGLGVLGQALRAVKAERENAAWAEFSVPTMAVPASREAWRVNAWRALLVCATTLVDTLSMLLLMSFNVWIVASTVLGVGLGSLLWGGVNKAVGSCHVAAD
jgi:hypothetical protein